MDTLYIVIPALIVLIGALIVWFAVRRIRSLRKKDYLVRRKVLERIALSLAIVTALAVLASSAINAVLLRHALANPPGVAYPVNGHKMRMDCTGSGSPTIVLDAGLGNDGLIWGGVQPVLAKTTRVCSYDRAGFGWSDALPAPRDADHVAAELHGLLDSARIDRPVVLMGHSIAGIYIRDYATRYPDDVAGLIFVDGSTPLQDRHPAFKALGEFHSPSLRDVVVNQGSFALGLPRLFGQCSAKIPGFDPNAAKLQGEDRCHEQFAAVDAEMQSFDRSGEETVHSGPYGALPILIFSQDPAKEGNSAKFVEISKAWNQMQEDLKKLSTRSRRIIAKGSGHYIQIEREDLIDREVPRFIDEVRGNAPQRTDYGSTTTE